METRRTVRERLFNLVVTQMIHRTDDGMINLGPIEEFIDPSGEHQVRFRNIDQQIVITCDTCRLAREESPEDETNRIKEG